MEKYLTEELLMQQALGEARFVSTREERAAPPPRNDVPVGALIFHQGQIIARSGNEVELCCDPTAHAEMVVLRKAAEVLKVTHLTECDLYVTLEPCAMCAGAISLARIRRLVMGALDPKRGGVFHGSKVFDQTTCHHKPSVVSGILEEPCGALLRQFFQQKRKVR